MRTMQRQSECGPLMSLPDDGITWPYKGIKILQLAVREVLDGLARNNGWNQFTHRRSEKAYGMEN